MILATALSIVAAQAVQSFWADSLETSKEMEEIRKKTTYTEVVCGAVEVSLPGQLPDIDLQCDPYYPGENSQGD